jgi:hypothetical protein
LLRFGVQSQDFGRPKQEQPAKLNKKRTSYVTRQQDFGGNISAVPLQSDVKIMEHGLPLVPVVAGVLLAYAGYFAYTLFHRIHRAYVIRM